MKLRLNRPNQCGAKATIGKLYVDDVFECYTLEDMDRRLEDGGKKEAGTTCIPRGTYSVITNFSNRFGKVLPQILDVPQFEAVRIHPGNSDWDTAGCILVGDNIINEDYIGGSRAAFLKFFNKIQAAICAGEEVTLEIV